MNPAIQIRDSIITRLQDELRALLPSGQIRGQLDVSGEPRGDRGLVVSCEDLGGHGGMPGRILVDVKANITAFTHLEEDQAGAKLDELVSEVITAVEGLHYSLFGWAVGFPGVWQSAPYEIMANSFRACTISATLFLQASN
ncbi:MAG: hypothetical protein IJS08_09030 [Victivallales bacterium]|nr:hypothetical protein [Victivallales bacterium]